MFFNTRILLITATISTLSFVILGAFGYIWLICPFILLWILGIVLVASLNKPRYTIEKENLIIPERFQAYHQELLALGFELDCVRISRTRFASMQQWFYRHKEESAEAYIHSERAVLWFSSYFEKGFDVSTWFQKGDVYETEKIVSHIVKSSIPATFDYHLQHRQKYLSQYGPILRFESLEQQAEWEARQETEKAIAKELNRSVRNMAGRFLLMLFVVFVLVVIIAIPVIIVLQFYLPERAEEIAIPLIMGIYTLGVVLGMVWVSRPYLSPKSVEERKKKEGFS